MTTASRYTIAMFTTSKRGCIAHPATVPVAVATMAHAYPMSRGAFMMRL